MNQSQHLQIGHLFKRLVGLVVSAVKLDIRSRQAAQDRTLLSAELAAFATNQNACLSVAVFLSGWLGKAMKGWKDQESRKAQRLGKARKD